MEEPETRQAPVPAPADGLFLTAGLARLLRDVLTADADKQSAAGRAPAEQALAALRAYEGLGAEAAGSAVLGVIRLQAGDFGAALSALRDAEGACAALTEPGHVRDSSGGLRLEAFGAGAVLLDRVPTTFRSHNAGRAVFLLALADNRGMHVEQLADWLWPDRTCDQGRLSGRVRTLLWDVRQGLGAEAWRLRRRGPHLRLDTAGVPIDVVGVRTRARSVLRTADAPAAARLADDLRRPLLTRWAYDEWVLTESAVNESLADRLDALASSRSGTAVARPAAVSSRV